MPPPDDSAARVPLGPIGHYVIANLEHLRRVRGLTYREMSDRLAQIGRPIPTLGLSRIEKGNRRVDVDDLVALAAVLETSPVELMEPRSGDVDAGWVRLAEGLRVPANRAGEWMAGLTLLPPQTSLPWPRSVYAARVRESEMADMRHRVEQLESSLEAALGRERAEIGELQRRAETAEEALRAERARNGHPQEEPAPPVVTAIVTSHLGVLVGHRNDDNPPWTFIAGEQEPGERIEDTVIREVKEETGLRIQVGDIIGRRVHPKTGRTMIYVAAHPTHGTDVFVGDEEELAEVRWVSLAEAEQLMKAYGMYEPVRDYLASAIGEG